MIKPVTALTARKAAPADDHGGDDVQFLVHRHSGVPGRQARNMPELGADVAGYYCFGGLASRITAPSVSDMMSSANLSACSISFVLSEA